jgi:hypothetical protein
MLRRNERKSNGGAGFFSLEPVAKLTREQAMTDNRTRYEHEGFMGRRVTLLPYFQLAKLMQPCQAPFDEPACLPQAAAVRGATLGQDGLYPFFLSFLRSGSES